MLELNSIIRINLTIKADKMMELGGINKENFVDQNFDYFDCIICSDVTIRPKMCQKCDHIFCGPCIQEWIKTNNFCPFRCNGKEDMKCVELPNSVKKLYGHLKVKCSRKTCDEEVYLKDLYLHEMDCGQERCISPGCEKAVRYTIGEINACGEKCLIYNLMKFDQKLKDDPEILFDLIRRFTKNARYQKINKAALCFSIPYWDIENVADELKVSSNRLKVQNNSTKKGFRTSISNIVRLS